MYARVYIVPARSGARNDATRMARMVMAVGVLLKGLWFYSGPADEHDNRGVTPVIALLATGLPVCLYTLAPVFIGVQILDGQTGRVAVYDFNVILGTVDVLRYAVAVEPVGLKNGQETLPKLEHHRHYAFKPLTAVNWFT